MLPLEVGAIGALIFVAFLFTLADAAWVRLQRIDRAPLLGALAGGAVLAIGANLFQMDTSGAFPNAEDDPVVVRFLGGTPRSVPERARAASPLHHLSPDDPPLLLFHGELDRRIDVEQARRFAAASKALGREDEVILLPGVDHGRDVLPGDEDSRERVRRFLARHLRPED